ncbi:hypothetical protein PAHAL_8G255000 [Panicum hallii]|uniref:Uncharacterized protein n=1 Tax=Panicum hallii TaxID=206008 RepID=A0A2S3IFB5_9POAL|nr:hypothetical protein PAHAL_8G255000 [Panicum hallii]
MSLHAHGLSHLELGFITNTCMDSNRANISSYTKGQVAVTFQQSITQPAQKG